ncbi:unnamed protein product, partial [Vitis vinifera]
MSRSRNVLTLLLFSTSCPTSCLLWDLACPEATTMLTTAAAHVLLYPFYSSGHIIPILDLATKLLSRGLEVTVLVTPSNLPLLDSLLSKYPSSFQSLVLPLPESGPVSAKNLLFNLRAMTGLSDDIIQCIPNSPSYPWWQISDDDAKRGGSSAVPSHKVLSWLDQGRGKRKRRDPRGVRRSCGQQRFCDKGVGPAGADTEAPSRGCILDSLRLEFHPGGAGRRLGDADVANGR